MTTQLSPFQFQSFQVRVQTDENGNPWFCANDVCEVLGYANPNDIIKKHCQAKGVSNRYPLETSGGVQYPNFISEGNLYRLIIKSNKPQAEPFEAWVCDEVLPTIRKTGSYAAKPSPAALPEPPTITKAQQGGLCALVSVKSKSSGKPIAYYWSRFNNHWRLASYKDLPADKFEEAMDYLKRLEGGNDPLLTVTPKELEALVEERARALEGEHLAEQDATPPLGMRLLLRHEGGFRFSSQVVPDDALVMTLDDYAEVQRQYGYVTVPATAAEAIKLAADYLNRHGPQAINP